MKEGRSCVVSERESRSRLLVGVQRSCRGSQVVPQRYVTDCVEGSERFVRRHREVF